MAYAVLRTAYGRFYAPFGLSPDDLGLGYLELLAQSAIGAVVILAIFGLMASIVVAMYVKVIADIRDDVRSFIRRRTGYRTGAVRGALRDLTGWAFVVVLGVGILLIAAIEMLTAVSVSGYVAGGAVLVATWVLSRQGAAMFRRGLLGQTMTATPSPTNWWRRGLAFGVMSIAVLTSAVFIRAAHGDAMAVREGTGIHSTLFGVRLTSWGADAATLSWTSDRIDDALRPLASSCLMYLGQSDGMLFVYSPHALGRATFRVPVSAAAVRIFPGAHCRPGARMPR